MSRTAIALLSGLAACGMQAHAEGPRVGTNPLRTAYFGQLHLHTAMSFDAYLVGTRLYPEEAYRYARGEPVQSDGRQWKLTGPPLDFLGVSDHSEYLGQMTLVGDPKGPLADTDFVKRLNSLPADQRFTLLFKLSESFGSGGVQPPELRQTALLKSSWQRQIDAANQYYQPGKFTTFVAYEYSSLPNGANLHRNVIFRGPNYPQLPFSSLDSANPEDLWRYIEHQRSLGIQALAIPHNSNVSDGLMFSYGDVAGRTINREYAETRVSIERLVEITQTKGTSETRPELSPNDDFAGFELIDNLLTVARPGSVHGSYVREALGRGLVIGQRTGVNPYEFGLIGGSDAHGALSMSSESEVIDSAKSAEEIKKLFEGQSFMGTGGSSAGLAGVWAESNTRESLFDALYRRETFATSGTRLRVRLFAGLNYPAGLTRQPDWLKKAYRDGVPMGADLSPASQAPVPSGPLRLLVQATKDPDGANLDRIQIVKVWLEGDAAKEKVFEVSWAGDRKLDAAGKLPAIGSSVDAQKATYTNDIGAVQLSTDWEDPEFKPDVPAVYYARVLEIPTPRWTTSLAVAKRLPLPATVPAAIQERAWTSPVFYRPR